MIKNYSHKSTPRNTMTVGNETGESKVWTMLTCIVLVLVCSGVGYLLLTVMG